MWRQTPPLRGRGARLQSLAVVGLAIVSVALAILVVLTFDTVTNRQRALIASIREDAVWAAYQIDGEAKKFGMALARFENKPSPEALKTVNLRFDILYSRIGVVSKGGYAGKFDGDPETSALADKVQGNVTDLALDMDRLAARGTSFDAPWVSSLVNTVQSKLDDVLAPSERLLNVVNLRQSRMRSESRQYEQDAYYRLALAVAALIGTLGVIVGYLWWNMRQIAASRLKLQAFSKLSAEAAERAEAGMRAKSIFLATMSHEIRTPLNGIIGTVDVMRQRQLAAEDRESLTVIGDCSDSLLCLIEDILDFSKLESGEVTIERRQVDLAEIVRSVSNVVLPRAETKDLKVTIDFPRVSVLTDPARLRQVLINLIGNAVKFTDNGTVEVRFTANKGTGRLDFEVVDSGIGICRDKIHRLFNEFSQVDPTISRRFGGTGLGLAICKKLVTAMKGDIGVDSVVGEGSRFWFSVPAGPIQDAQDCPVEDVESEEVARVSYSARVLIAEDNDINFNVLSRLLGNMGIECDHAPNGEIAVHLASMRDYAAIFMDVQMPVMDGHEATRAIRGAGMTLPIVGVTANAFESDRQACLDAGMSDFMSKPVTFAKVRKAVDRALSGCVDAELPDAPHESDTATPMIDLRYRKALLDEIGCEALDELTREFWCDATGMVTRARASLDEGRTKDAVREVHTLKGVAATLGLTGLANEAKAAQVSIQEGGEPDFTSLQVSLMHSMIVVGSDRDPEAREAA